MLAVDGPVILAQGGDAYRRLVNEPRRAHQAPFHMQSFPLMVEARAKEGPSDSERDFLLRSFIAHRLDARIAALAKVEYGGRSPQKPRKIVSPPGSRMLSIGNVISFFSPKTKERVCDQAVADFREAHYAALQEGDRAKIRRIVFQHWVWFIVAVGGELVTMFGRDNRAVKGAD